MVMEAVEITNEWAFKKTGMSISLATETLYIHFSPEFTIDKTYYNKQGDPANFFEALNYALTHEELHLTFDKIGEDSDLVDEPLVSWAVQWSIGLCFNVPKYGGLKE